MRKLVLIGILAVMLMLTGVLSGCSDDVAGEAGRQLAMASNNKPAQGPVCDAISNCNSICEKVKNCPGWATLIEAIDKKIDEKIDVRVKPLETKMNNYEFEVDPVIDPSGPITQEVGIETAGFGNI